MASLDKTALYEIAERYQEYLEKPHISKSISKNKEAIREKFRLTEAISLPEDSQLEKVWGTNNLDSVSSLLRGFEVGQAVGMIFNPAREPDNWAVGTAFLIAPNLLLTNNHVIESKEKAAKYQLKMNFQRDLERKLDPTFDFILLPTKTFFTDKNLDFTIVEVANKSIDKQISLTEFGYLKLIEESGKAIKGDSATIIQHPDGKSKQTAFFENKVENDTHPEFITYTTDTMAGSSGSPVFNYQWVVFALHHSGVPTKEYLENISDVVEESSIVFQKSQNRNLNEGIRISAIMKKIKDANSKIYKQVKLAAEAGDEKTLPFKPYRFSRETWKESDFESVKPENTENSQEQNAENTVNIITNPIMDTIENVIRVNIPLEIRIGQPFVQQNQIIEINDDLERRRKKSNNEVIDLAGRNGFDAQFLGSRLKIDLSKLVKPFADKKLVTPLIDGGDELKYTHFSVMMHKTRKMCIVAAVNIDGGAEKKIPRGEDKWLTDNRIEATYQLDNRMYANNDLDRGHMVRREDPNWGPDAEKANLDTFFYTNATPQHKDLNQKEWLQLEDYVLKNANINDLKVSVLTGPILDENFTPYREGVVPFQFYKIVAFIKKDKKPSVTGYVLSQKNMIDDLEAVGDFVFGEFKTYQIPLSKLENMSGLDLSILKPHDPLFGQEGQESTIREISEASDLLL